jgi:hypothetical protein
LPYSPLSANVHFTIPKSCSCALEFTGDKPENRAECRDRGDTARGMKWSGWGSIELSWVTWTPTKEPLLESYATRVPEALGRHGSEERRTVYTMLGLRVDALPDKSLRVQGAFGEETLVCHHDRT